MISCASPERAAYGWQRDGGHADLMLIHERARKGLHAEATVTRRFPPAQTSEAYRVFDQGETAGKVVIIP